MLNPVRVDAIVDLAYGALIVLAIILIATLDEFGIGIAFGLGVFSAYVVHVVWKMARFDPDWMTSVVQETVSETVEEEMEKTVEKTVGKTVEEEMEKTVEKTVGKTVEELIEESKEGDR